MLKRALDILGAVIGIGLTWPFLIMAAILIKLEDGGPVVFVQSRVGLQGKQFLMIKLRTMRVGAEREQQFTMKYGFPSDGLASENYLTYARLEELSRALNLDCQVLTPFYGLGWALRPWKARFLQRREPAKFHLVILQANRLPANGLQANERERSLAEVRC